MVSCPWIDCKRRGKPQYDAGLGLPRYASKRAQLLLLKLESTLYCCEFRFQFWEFFKIVYPKSFKLKMSHRCSGSYNSRIITQVQAWSYCQDRIFWEWSYLKDRSFQDDIKIFFIKFWYCFEKLNWENAWFQKTSKKSKKNPFFKSIWVKI